MVNIHALHPVVQAWLLEGPLAPYVPAYAARLERGRYAANTASRWLGAVAHFAHWMSSCFLPVTLLTEGCIDQFLHYHLPRCDCPGAAVRTPQDVHAALVSLLALLRQQRVIAELPPPAGPIAEELGCYDAHMRDARGLCATTRRNRLRIVDRLLQTKFSQRLDDFSELRPDDVQHFIAGQMESLDTVSNAITIAAALRAYFRYRATLGDTVGPLLGVIASPAHWSLAPLPRALEPEQVERLLQSFTDELPSPRRGYAVIRLALDLGLRSIEISQLQLDDIDWRMGTVTLKRTKARRQHILPLPAVTGRALEDYVRHERPRSELRTVFVRRLAPHDQPIGVDAIRRVVRDAFRRVGIPHGRSHALRHTLACRLVGHGSSIKEVADVLRHRSMNTSLIYAKLDFGALTEVALPWPGSAA